MWGGGESTHTHFTALKLFIIKAENWETAPHIVVTVNVSVYRRADITIMIKIPVIMSVLKFANRYNKKKIVNIVRPRNMYSSTSFLLFLRIFEVFD
jgi:subtilisin-like proprotein convertase family protein